MSLHDSDERWDEDGCAFCGRTLGRPRSGIGARICFDCARPEPTHEYKSDGNRRDPSCLTCGRYRLDAIHNHKQAEKVANAE